LTPSKFFARDTRAGCEGAQAGPVLSARMPIVIAAFAGLVLVFPGYGISKAAPPLVPAESAGPDSRFARTANEDGLRAMAAGDYPAALTAFREAAAEDPGDAEIVNNLGFVYQRLGNAPQAECFYREALGLDSRRIVVRLNLVDLILETGNDPARLDEAAGLLEEARERSGNSAGIIVRQARVAVRQRRFADAERFFVESLRTEVESPPDQIRLELGDFYRSLGRESEARQCYRLAGGGGEIEKIAKERIRGLEVDRLARRFGWVRRPVREGPASLLVEQGRALMREGKFDEAERILEGAVEAWPLQVESRLALGDLFRQVGRAGEAESSYLRALALDPAGAEAHARLGALYLETPGGRRSAEAAVFLARAIELRPDWNDLLLSLARARRASGDLDGALRSVRSCLAGSPAQADRAEALAIEEAISNAPRPAARAPRESPASRKEDISSRPAGAARASSGIGRARALLARGEPEAALAELASLDREGSTEIRNLEGRIYFAAGRLDDARDAFLSSLSFDETQSEVHRELGQVLLSLGKPRDARQQLWRAAELGDRESWFPLAKVDSEAPPGEMGGLLGDALRFRRVWFARREAIRFLMENEQSARAGDGRALEKELSGRLRNVLVAGASLLIAAAAVPLILIRRFVGGASVLELLVRSPEAGPDISRILTAIRHEILKHNTTALASLIERVRKNEEVSEGAASLERTLFGEGGVFLRYRVYSDQVESVGRTHGIRVNARRRDPALGSIEAAFAGLRKTLPRMSGWSRLRARRRRLLQTSLESAAAKMNDAAPRQIREILLGIGSLVIDQKLVESIFDRIRNEPALARVPVAPLEIRRPAALPASIRMPRSSLDDVLANLFRNAIQSSVRSGLRPVVIGFDVLTEVDDVTGLERLVMRVLDRSSENLSPERLARPPSGGGLSLAVEQVVRIGGAITLDESPSGGWSKAVAVRFPGEEAQ